MIGESAVDDGGCFRDSLTEICFDLKNGVVPLLSKTNNQSNGHGPEQDKFVLNTGTTSDTGIKMFEFLGALMGMSFRSGILLDLNLSRFTWK